MPTVAARPISLTVKTYAITLRPRAAPAASIPDQTVVDQRLGDRENWGMKRS